MGGAPCRIQVHMIMGEFTAIPADPLQLPEFDRRLREVYKTYEFDQSIVNETTYTDQVCKIAAKKLWAEADRELLWDGIRDVCGSSYP